MGDDGRSPEQQTLHLCPNSNKEKRSRGPRSLCLKRSENGFGFTLRHFVVYPPESYTLLARDRRYGLRGAPADRPMDTIFVKSVRPGSGAALAGLSPGDQLVSVNGEPIGGRSYAQVVHLIQSSPNYLHLLVVPKEEDLLQLYYGETAHNPKTNQRPRQQRSRSSPQRSSTSSSSPGRRVLDSTSSHLPVVKKMPAEPEFGNSGSESGGYSLPPNLAGCRLSLDGGSSRRDSQDTIHSSDDSIILSRIRKSLEQKEEFLRGASVQSPSPLREFYSRPNKLQSPVWPPAIPASAVPGAAIPPRDLAAGLVDDPRPESPRGFVYGGPATNAPMLVDPGVAGGGRYTARLSRIHEGGGRLGSPPPTQSQGSARVEAPQQWSAAAPVAASSNLVGNESTLPVTPLRIVSERARQFETGQCVEDRTDLYRSELTRLATKKANPNVAVRKREFESRAVDWRQNRESRSLDSTSDTDSNVTAPWTSPLALGNRTIPIGSNKLHCDPPKDYHEISEFPQTKPVVTTRPRSNSVESVWSEKKPSRSSSSDPPQRHKAVRQDSYLAAVKKPVPQVQNKEDMRELREVTPPSVTSSSSSASSTPTPRHITRRPTRPTRLDLVNTLQPLQGLQSSPSSTPESEHRNSSSGTPSNGVVKRIKPLLTDDQGSDDERSTRRVSYIKATWADRIHVESDLELSDNEPILSAHRRAFRKWRPPLFPDDIQRLRRLFEPMPTIFDSCVIGVPQKDIDILIEGPLCCKVTQIDGKKAHDRSWRNVWAVVRDSVLYLFKEKKDATSDTPVDHERVELNGSTVSAAEDYTKKRHVLRLSTQASSEILLQAENADEMSRWLSALASSNESISQLANAGQNVSPMSAHKGIMKNITTPFRNRSPTGQSPVNKTRKPSQTVEVPVNTTQKNKTWKNRMAKQLKKIQSGSGSPVSPTAPASYQEGATIGVPLELCPRSKNNEFVPLLVELCTGIVEERGLDIVGIYRVPGNTAAITSLTEAVNKGLKDALNDQDQRWSDVNVISSLLKLFFRKLPDCLLTTDLYPSFIKADKIEDAKLRIVTIRKLVNELPEHHLQTLRHLMMHLKLVVEHSAVNKMEARNLAMMFGPNLLRANDDSMVTMVTDMSHQCRIIETLIQHADWIFSDDSLDSISLNETLDHSGQASETDSNQSLLLSNVHKLEGMKGAGEVSRRDIVTSIITAANKKMLKSITRKQIVSVGDDVQFDRGDKRKDSSGSTVAPGSRKGSGVDVGTTAGGGCGNNSIELSDGSGATLKSLVAGAVAAGVRGSVMFSESILSSPHLEQIEVKDCDVKTEETPSKPTPTCDGTIVTYAGLSETTQERIRRFEMETKAMLQRDKLLNNKDWLKPTAPPAIGSKIADRGQQGVVYGNKSRDLAELRAARNSTGAAPSGLTVPVPNRAAVDGDDALSIPCGSSLDSLTDAAVFELSQNSTNSADGNGGGVDLVSSLTLTFDAKMKSLGLSSPSSEGPQLIEASVVDNKIQDDGTDGGEGGGDGVDSKEEGDGNKFVDKSCFRDPSLHRSFTSPNLESKVLEFPKDDSEKEKDDKDDVEKDDEKENCGDAGSGTCVKVKRSESFKQRGEERKDAGKLLRRSESLNKKDSGGGQSGNKLKRSDSLTKTEKTDLNLTKRRQALEASTKKMKRKTGGGGERSIKRRHTVGGTKDFDKAAWLDNKEREASEERRTSSPDLTSDMSRPVLVLRPHSMVVPSATPLESHI